MFLYEKWHQSGYSVRRLTGKLQLYFVLHTLLIVAFHSFSRSYILPLVFKHLARWWMLILANIRSFLTLKICSKSYAKLQRPQYTDFHCQMTRAIGRAYSISRFHHGNNFNHNVNICFCFLSSINRLVSSYLVHHGYSATAESFAKGTEQNLNEEITSIKTRQSMSGRIA